jgi:hypothetical protein
MSFTPQQAVSLAIPDRRIDPMPCGRGVDEVERLSLALPLLERLDVDLDGEARQVAARPFGEVGSQLHADDREASLHQGSRRLAGRAADLQQAVARLEAGHLDQVVEEFVGVFRASLVVEVCR